MQWLCFLDNLNTNLLCNVYFANSVDLMTFESIPYKQIPQDGLQSYSVW